MHLQVGEDLHGPYLLPEVRLPAQAAVLFPVALGNKDES